MNNYIKSILIAGFCAITATASAKTVPLSMEPPFWWTGMNNPQLQIMVHGDNIRDAVPSTDYAGVAIDSVVRLDSKNYQIIYLNVSPQAQPGTINFTFQNGKKKTKAAFELKQRDGVQPNTFTSEDVLYLIMTILNRLALLPSGSTRCLKTICRAVLITDMPLPTTIA